MTVTEYTAARAAVLRGLNFPEIEAPTDMKILWFDSTRPDKISDALTRGSHTHSFYELHIIFSGEFQYTCDEQSFFLKNNAILIPPCTPHDLKKCTGDFLKISVAFSLESEAAQRLLPLPKTPCIFEYTTQTVKNIEYIYTKCDHPDCFTPTIIGNRVLEIIYAVCQALIPELPQNVSSADPRVYVAKRFIENNRHRLLSCNDVALECCLSTKQLNRIFKKHVGKTINEYIICEKARHAKKLLLQNEHTVKEIGFALGFENERSFSLFFRRHFGMSPGAYRSTQKDT